MKCAVAMTHRAHAEGIRITRVPDAPRWQRRDARSDFPERLARGSRRELQVRRPVRPLSPEQDRPRHCPPACADCPRGGIYRRRMTGMFGGARWRMVGWSILVLCVILLAISAVLFVSLNRTL